MMSNCDNCIFRGQWCEKENKCPLFKKTRNLKKERIAMNREKVMSWLEGLSEPDWRVFHSDSEVQNIAKSALDLMKEQEEQKRKWLQTIADTQLAISPTGYESEDELAKRGWEWNGLQMAWEIIAGEERSEHPRLVRCKNCKHYRINTVYPGTNMIMKYCAKTGIAENNPDWFCADGERQEGE